MIRTELARQYFRNSFNCSQSVLCVFAHDLGISRDSAMKLASAFGAGIARQQLTCGAVTGAIMALSLKFGKGLRDDDSRKTHAYSKALELMEEFKKRNKSITCLELLDGLDMIADIDKINELGYFKTRCVDYVMDAVEITEELLRE